MPIGPKAEENPVAEILAKSKLAFNDFITSIPFVRANTAVPKLKNVVVPVVTPATTP